MFVIFFVILVIVFGLFKCKACLLGFFWKNILLFILPMWITQKKICSFNSFNLHENENEAQEKDRCDLNNDFNLK